MRDVLYMAWRYLAYNRFKTLILILSITLIIFLPAAMRILVKQSATALTARAEATPLLVGAKGSPLELVLNSLYFESDTPPVMRYREVERIALSGLASAIPIYNRFDARGYPIVGTTLDYFDFRGLRIAEGEQMVMIGECVLGAEVAAGVGIAPGGSIISSPESVYDLAGAYPLKMRAVGVLAPSGTPDDRAIFVDLKTAWIIEGLAHGHQELSKPEAAGAVLRRGEDGIVANASVMQYKEITPDNIDSFHFHGDQGEFPVTGVIAVPDDTKSGTLLRGRYLGKDEPMQILRPSEVVDDLLATVLTVQKYVVAGVALIGLSALATAVLVFMLSLRLRRREIETMRRIGGARGRVFALLASEIAAVVLASLLLAGALTALVSYKAEALFRAFFL